MENSSSNVSASSTNNSGHRGRDPRSRVLGISIKCWCGANIVEKISGSDDNPFRRYYRCGFAYSNKLRDDPHVFKWVDEAYRNEIQQLEYQVGQIEEEMMLMKSGGNPVGGENVVIPDIVLNDFETELFDHVKEMLVESRRSMKRMMCLVFGACLLVVVIGIIVEK